ncbi:MAG: type III secretion protein [Pseudomonadota bacterium]
MSSINILSSSLGIQTVMDSMPSQEGLSQGMMQARPLATTVIREAGLEEVYNPATAESLMQKALCPDVGDGEMLQPEVFRANLKASMEDLSLSRDPAVRDFVKQDLGPLLENNELLQAYTGLMVGG